MSLSITVTGVLTLQDGGYSPMYTDVIWWWTTAFSGRRYHYTGKHTHNVLHFFLV